MRNSLMDRVSGNQIDVILTHPQHQHSFQTLIKLIRALRECRSVEDFYHFQQQLLELILEVEKRRSEVRRVLTRLRKEPGKLPARAPDLGTGLDPLDRDSWMVEDEVFERVWRQLKSIGDALAWKLFNYDRRVIVGLSRGEPAGPMYGKVGLVREREVVETAWRDNGEFVLLHDLTAALRVGDVSRFCQDGGVLLDEIKTNDRYRNKKQDQKLVATSHALADGGTLPSGHTPVATGIPFKTDLKGLREVLGLAHRRGIQGAVVSSGRAVVAASQLTAGNLYTADTFSDRFTAELDRCRRRIGNTTPEHRLTLVSLDQAARSSVRPPWAIYPVAPEVAASLIADAMFFFVCMSPDAIINGLSEANVHARWLQRLNGPVDWAKPLLAVAARTTDKLWFTSLNPEAISPLMLELVDLRTWCTQVASTLSGDIAAGVLPWPYFKDEDKTWF
ncbi:hypothetical protein KZZ52_51715 [Dactylosporangium sp. AC04546]|uniref:hypothetical protein n=1 Tax=Dactylosporangium sp. AC04546 TaxID=2862460 RepID=UPI001EDE98EC|nr:hypothetical protein [Dactylosporangium sp. AC04546]WVK82330.1 hypothetical protein KZZ52_51715 [Dactylosporangium sp. AC04546]